MSSIKRMRALPALAGVAAIAVTSAAVAKNWDNWSAPANLESLPGSSSTVNTAAVDGCASHSRDGLMIVFNSSRGGNQDLYMATRASTSDGFGTPVALPSPVNGSSNEACPTLANGNRLYFSSDRDDAAYDLYVSKLGPDGWSDPVTLGSSINRAGWLDEAVDFFEDEDGNEVMIFTSRLPNGTQGKIYQVVNGGTPSLVQGGPHSSASDARASVTNDGLTIFWDSTRTGTLGGPDIYYATRSSTSDPFGTAMHLQDLSSSAFEARPYISKDGTFLTFSSARAGSESAAPDIWFAERSKVTGNSGN
jgi:Tol biopolymer transport system component